MNFTNLGDVLFLQALNTFPHRKKKGGGHHGGNRVKEITRDGVSDIFQVSITSALGSGIASVSANSSSRSGPTCSYRDKCKDGECTNISRSMSITEEEYTDCRADVVSSGRDRGFTCWD
jgi:hypothetical protein